MGVNQAIIQQPGLGTEREAAFRRVLNGGVAKFATELLVIDGAESADLGNTGDLDVLRAGKLMGKITASGKYANSIIGNLAVLHDTSVVTVLLTVPVNVAVEVDRRIGQAGNLVLTGPPAAAGTVATEVVAFTAVNTTTGVITITATAADFAIGSWVQANDGSETLKTIMPDGFGQKISDVNKIRVDVDYLNAYLGGDIDFSQLLDVSTEAGLIARVKTELNAVGTYTFNDDL